MGSKSLVSSFRLNLFLMLMVTFRFSCPAALIAHSKPAHAALEATQTIGTSFSPPSAAAPTEFSNTSEIRRLGSEDAGREYPVYVRATVTGYSFRGGYFVQDETGPIYIQTTLSTGGLRIGQVVEIQGMTSPGLYAPQIRESSRTVVGQAELPLPRRLNHEQLASGKEDCQYAEIEGVVRRAVRPSLQFPNTGLFMLAMGDGRVELSIFDAEAGDLNYLVGARVRVRGVVSGRFNERRQWVGARFNVSSLSNIEIMQPAPLQPFDVPLNTTRSLLQWDPSRTEARQRIKVQGVVTYFRPGETLFIREQLAGLQILTSQVLSVKPGDIVDVIGFPTLGTYSPVLQDAEFKYIGRSSDPKPFEATSSQLLQGGLDAGLVSVKGVLLESVRRRGERVLVVQTSNVVFNAHIDQPAEHPLLDSLRAGSLLELTGVSLIEETISDGSRLWPKMFSLLLRSPSDIAVVKMPPLWSTERLVQTLALVSLVSLIILGWVWLLRRQVSEQAALIGQKVQQEAVLEERTRIAREFHDTLEQELTGVSLQLEAIAHQAGGSPVHKQLELTHRLLLRCQSEVRQSVWDLRRPMLTTGQLGDALKEHILHVCASTAIPIQFAVHGQPVCLPALTQHHLLRIAQEAVSNSLKHAHPGSVCVDLRYETGVVRLRVEDEGCGFTLEQAAGSDAGHFGLVGMSERAGKMGGKLTVRSQPGQGTCVDIIIPTGSTPEHSARRNHLTTS
ncbi:MAG: sensor histidine kinase [Verrucomicrobiota bacterium]